jgi:ankyrin repeat protein
MSDSIRRRSFLALGAGAAVAATFPANLYASVSVIGASGEGNTSVDAGAGAVIDLKNETDPYRRAVIDGNLAVVQQHLEKDPALLYARDAQGQSVYLLAAYAGQPAVMALFESKGLVLDIYEAAAGGKTDRVNELLRPAPGLVKAPNAAGDTPLHAAALASQSKSIDSMISPGPDYTIPNPKRKNATAAHIGLQSPQREAAEAMAFTMVGNGLNPNIATTDGNTILHCAAITGYPRVIRLLLQKGGDAGARNAAGQTPLDIAMQGKKNDAAELLRNPGLIPQDYYAHRYAYDSKFGSLKRDDTEGLPMEFINSFTIVSHFGFDRVKQWVRLCPDLLNTRAAWDELPVEAAAHMGRADIGGHLLDLGASYSICTATVFGSPDDVKRLLAEDSRRIHERGAHSFPLLWYTAFGKPKIDAAEYLIHMGANPNEDMRGRTVLHIAASLGHLELCRFFLEKGLDPLQKGTNFQGTQDAVEAANASKHPEVAAMMREWTSQKSSH